MVVSPSSSFVELVGAGHGLIVIIIPIRLSPFWVVVVAIAVDCFDVDPRSTEVDYNNRRHTGVNNLLFDLCVCTGGAVDKYNGGEGDEDGDNKVATTHLDNSKKVTGKDDMKGWKERTDKSSTGTATGPNEGQEAVVEVGEGSSSSSSGSVYEEPLNPENSTGSRVSIHDPSTTETKTQVRGWSWEYLNTFIPNVF